MKHRFHQRHFVQAWKTMYAQKVWWFFGPVVALIGSATVLDDLLTTLRFLPSWLDGSRMGEDVWHAFVNAPLSAQISLLVAIVLTALVLLTIQGAVVRGLYAHKRARVQIHDAFAHGLKRLRATVGITVLMIALLGGVFAFAIALLQALTSYNATWNITLNIAVYGLTGVAVFALVSVELLALNIALGAGEPATDAIAKAFALVRRHPILILEHNVILALIYTVSSAIVILVVLALLIPFALPFLSLALSSPALPNWMGALPIAILALGGWFALGLITLYNYATWAELTRRLLRAPSFSSRFVHTLRTYIPLFR